MSAESRALLDATVEVAECMCGAPRLAHRSAHPELIAVSVDEIGTVVLRGAVAAFPERRAAVRDARRVDGIFEVVDRLKLRLPFACLRADDELGARASTA